MALYSALTALLLFTLSKSGRQTCGCDECSGGVVDITFTNLGPEASCTLFDEKNEVTYGPETLSTGDSIRASGDLSNEMIVDCGGSRIDDIHLSCSQPVYVGLVLARAMVQVTAGVSEGGGNLCIGEGECECKGGVTDITFINRGAPTDCYIQDGNTRSATVTVGTGETFGATGSKDDNRFNGDIDVVCGDGREFELHTSCSQPVDIGTFYPDAELEIYDGASRENGLFCNSPSIVPPPAIVTCATIEDSDECGSTNGCCFDEETQLCNRCTGETCCDCEGGYTYFRFRNLGPRTLCTIYDKENGAKYAALLNTGDDISAAGNGTRGDFGQFLHVDCGEERCEYICTDCSQDLYEGIVLEKANLQVIRSTSLFNGLVCPTPARQGDCECDGGVTELTFTNTGPDTTCTIEDEKADITYPSQFVANGDTFSASGTLDDGKFGKEIVINCGSGRESSLHLSCSQPVYIGLPLPGAQLEISSGESRDNGLLCVGPEQTD